MKWFGQHWGAPLCDEVEHVPTPLGRLCEWCDEGMEEGGNGFLIPHMGEHGLYEGAWHYECFQRSVIGSVSHVLKTCSCYVPGASETDPEELTIRQAARLAVELWEKEHESR